MRCCFGSHLFYTLLSCSVVLIQGVITDAQIYEAGLPAHCAFSLAMVSNGPAYISFYHFHSLELWHMMKSVFLCLTLNLHV
uniref:Secreted protein n=1 Tax=Kalanchoe fedtschenkoi TaxID=63787 RepID=A0A7N0UFC4_KALFE